MEKFQLPPGFSFLPRDDQLVQHFLLPKVTNNPLPVQGLIQDCDLYGEIHPWELFKGREREKTGYFFTKLKKKGKEGKIIIRTVGDKGNGGGTWRIQARGTDVINEKRRVIGKKSSFSYICQGNSGEWGQWNMKEYSLDGDLLGSELREFRNVVLCQITNQENSNKRKRNHETSCGTQSAMGISMNTDEYAPMDTQEIVQEQQHDNLLWEHNSGIAMYYGETSMNGESGAMNQIPTDQEPYDPEIVQEQQHVNLFGDHNNGIEMNFGETSMNGESGTINQISTDQEPCDPEIEALLGSWRDLEGMNELPDSLFR